MKQDQKSQATTTDTPELIFQIASGFMAAKHLFVANEVGLFEQLADGPTCAIQFAPGSVCYEALS
jgi:hypothetical protein